MSVNITDAIFAQAERDPDAIAVIDAKISASYRVLCHGVRSAAQRFRQAQWKAGDIVGISLHNSSTLYLVSALALARMGITQVSIPANDPASLRAARMERLGVTGLVVEHGRSASSTPGSSVTTVAIEANWLTQSPDIAAVDDIREPGGDSLWIISETSGTTATPKAIGISHTTEDIHRKKYASILVHLPGERVVSLTNMQFLTGLKRAIGCLSDGGTFTIPPTSFSTDQLLKWIEWHCVTYISCVPLHLHQLLRDIQTSTPRLPSVRVLRSGSAALPVSAVREIRRRISPNLYIAYSASETGPIATATPAMLDENPGTVGLPLEGIEFEIVDNDGSAVSVGMLGHVRVRGPGIETPYLHATDAGQAKAFRGGWFYPGDIAVVNSDGLVFLKGRSDDVMNFDGIMVGPAEIESVLRQHPAVKEVAAFALPSPDHQDIPAAAIVSAQPLQIDELQHFCIARLGVRAPRVFLRFDEIPKNSMGKILRRRVTELAVKALKKPPRS